MLEKIRKITYRFCSSGTLAFKSSFHNMSKRANYKKGAIVIAPFCTISIMALTESSSVPYTS